ncbi:MAG: baseplate J/gp47 family protein [Candidatus Dormibacteraeota bacterium]|nr:baseplate J/gp47 family protein [Candidatus Dormibacteraeota bacterium]
MAVDPVYIETEEEIPGVIERIMRTSTPEVPLVLPTRSRFGQSRFNFQLLNRYAKRLGKSVTIVSADPNVQRMARESGFASVPALTQYGSWTSSAVPPAVSVVPVPGPARSGSEAPAGDRPGLAVPVPFAAVPLAAPAPDPTAIGGPAPGARRRAPRITVARLAPRVAEFKPARVVLYAGAALVLLVGLVGMIVFVPSAKVTLVAQAKPFDQAASVVADSSSQAVHVRVASAAQSASGTYQATGVQSLPATVAKGSVAFDASSCGSTAYSIRNGTRLVSNSGLQYATNGGDVALPAGGQASTSIVAANAGAGGNQAASGPFVFLHADEIGSCVQVSGGPTSGGADAQKKTVLAQADLDQARAALQAQLQPQILAALTRGVQKGEKLNGDLQYQPPEFNATNKVGDAVAQFTATMKLSAEGDYYRSDDVTRAFGQSLAQKVPVGYQLTGKVTAEYTVAAAAGGHLTFAGKAHGYVAPRIDLESVKSRLTGKWVSQAHTNLRALPVQSAAIRQAPLALPFMPLVGSRIDVEYDVASGVQGPISAG